MTIEEAHKALEELKDRHRQDHPGGCRMFSQGENCQCTLCLCDNLHEFLEKAQKAQSMETQNISRATYAQFLARRAEVKRVQEALEPHAREIIVALTGDDPTGIAFHSDRIDYTTPYGDWGESVGVHLLFLEDWEKAVQEKRAERRRKCEVISAQRVKEEKEREERKERAELERLLLKYPDVSQNR